MISLFHLLPFPHIGTGSLHLGAFPVVLFKIPVPHGGVGKTPAFQVLNNVKVLSLLLGGFPFLPDFPLAVALCRVAVTPEQVLALREVGFFGLAAAPAVQKPVCPCVVRLFQGSCSHFINHGFKIVTHKLSPSLYE